MREKLRVKLITLIRHEVVQYFAERIADHLIANGVTIPVRCKDCKHRGDYMVCPMCFEEQIEWDDDGYSEIDWIVHDRALDDGFCDRGERRTDAETD